MASGKIQAAPNGPYLVHDAPALKNSKGADLETKDVTALCRCGNSENKPFCDGTHWDGFTDDKN